MLKVLDDVYLYTGFKDRKSCEVCDDVCELQSHHIHSRSNGGPDLKYNRASLCAKCHSNVHWGHLILEGRFDTTSGDRLVWRKRGEPPVTFFEEPSVWLHPNALPPLCLTERFIDYKCYESANDISTHYSDVIMSMTYSSVSLDDIDDVL